jgi:GcrA cell cycle regulator
MWPEERTAELLRLRDEHLTGSQIAARLGTTRSAVIGKLRRLDLGPISGYRRGTAVEAKNKPERRRSKLYVTNSAAVLREVPIQPLPQPKPSNTQTDQQIPHSQRCTLMQLGRDSCRWPVGEIGTPEFFFCGATRIDGSPYCASHTRRALRALAALYKAARATIGKQK